MTSDFDIANIDEIIHGRLRLGIMAYLSTAEVAEFNELKDKLQTSDGNLSVHLRKLEEAGYVTIKKSFSGRKPLTRALLTEKGRTAFVAYLDAIEKLVPRG
jgi:DNA-binding HxlR family transcriptional regulator